MNIIHNHPREHAGEDDMCAAEGQKSCRLNPYYIIIIITTTHPNKQFPKSCFPKAYFKTEFQTTQTLQLIIIIIWSWAG
jgi:hypothetical protein